MLQSFLFKLFQKEIGGRYPRTAEIWGKWERTVCLSRAGWWENVMLTKRVLSRLTAPSTWAASLGWTSSMTCCNIYMEYYVPVEQKSSLEQRRECAACKVDYRPREKSQLTYKIIHVQYIPVVFTSSYDVFARPITQIVFHMKCNQL